VLRVGRFVEVQEYYCNTARTLSATCISSLVHRCEGHGIAAYVSSPYIRYCMPVHCAAHHAGTMSLTDIMTDLAISFVPVRISLDGNSNDGVGVGRLDHCCHCMLSTGISVLLTGGVPPPAPSAFTPRGAQPSQDDDPQDPAVGFCHRGEACCVYMLSLGDRCRMVCDAVRRPCVQFAGEDTVCVLEEWMKLCRSMCGWLWCRDV